MNETMDQLREDVRATAPTPTLEFVARMDRAVESGFAKERSERRPLERWSVWGPAAALACTALVAVVVGLASLDTGSDDEGDAGVAAGGGSAETAPAGQPEGGEPLSTAGGDEGGAGSEFNSGEAAATPPASADALAPETRSAAPATAQSDRVRGRDGNRVVERSTRLELETAADKFQETADEVLQVADDSGSIVQSSRVSERDGKAFARYDLRVPSSRLDETLAELTRLAHVTSRSSSSQDITRAYVSATDRLDDARAERNALLKALEKADTDVEAEAIRRQIALARNRIAIAERDVEALERRADRAKVSVTLRSTGKRSEEDGGAWTPGDAFADAGRILQVAAGVVVVTAAALLPVAILALLAWIAVRAVWRRRREAALDAG
jgi:Domain of unknown function (DUF4349)